MAKTFYTEHEIEDMFKAGMTRLEMSDDVVLTGLAYEKAVRLGMQLVQATEQVSDAPVRPYISKAMPQAGSVSSIPFSMPSYSKPAANAPATGLPADLTARIKNAVIAKLGSNVDQSLLDAIIRRVLDQVKV